MACNKSKVLVNLSTIWFIIMIVMNVLANLLPINGETTAAISDSYPNLFAPTGLTFSIWGVIYLALGAYIIWQQISLSKDNYKVINDRINFAFMISSVANSLWILAWHYRVIWLSLLLTLVVLGSLIVIALEAKNLDWKIRVPFSLYFGWVTVATIANVTTWLVSIGYPMTPVSENLHTVAILLIGLAIASITIWRQHDAAYGLVVMWAYLGIYLKHTDPNQFDYGYIAIVNTALFSLAVLGALTLWVALPKKAK